MKRGKSCALFAIALLLEFGLNGLAASSARAEEVGARGRALLEKWQNAVVKVKVVAKVRVIYEGESEQSEQTNETTATVIDPSWLAVASLAEMDPTHIWEAMARADAEVRWEAEIAEVKMRLPDGKEVPAEIVLRDRDLDLAFLRPTEPLSAPAVGIDFSASVKPQPLDQIFILDRLGEIADRVPAISLDRIEAIVHRPRTFYIAGFNSLTSGSAGSPVFSLEGNVVGLIVIRAIPATGDSEETTLPIILPAEDVLAVSKQAHGR